MEELLGKLAYRNTGFFSFIIGKVVKSNNKITDYALEFKDGSMVGFNTLDQITLYEEELV